MDGLQKNRENYNCMEISACIFARFSQNKEILKKYKKKKLEPQYVALPSFHSLVSQDFSLSLHYPYLMNDSRKFTWNYSRMKVRPCVFTSFFFVKKMPSTHCSTLSLLADRNESLLRKNDRSIVMPKGWSNKFDYWKRSIFSKKIVKTQQVNPLWWCDANVVFASRPSRVAYERERKIIMPKGWRLLLMAVIAAAAVAAPLPPSWPPS